MSVSIKKHIRNGVILCAGRESRLDCQRNNLSSRHEGYSL